MIRQNSHTHATADEAWVDGIIDVLLASRNKKPGTPTDLPVADVLTLCNVCREVLLSQPMLLELGAPIKICGDIHGQFNDLLRLFEYGGFPPEVSTNFRTEGCRIKKCSFYLVAGIDTWFLQFSHAHAFLNYVSQSNYLFLGDYVDRGKQSVEVVCLLFAYKIKYPENFFILRGNHECAGINRIYGFYDECRRRYSVKVWKQFCNTFNCLPCTAIIDDKIICMHGGLSPQLSSVDQIQNISRPCEVPDTGLLCDLLWSDPDVDQSVSIFNYFESHLESFH